MKHPFFLLKNQVVSRSFWTLFFDIYFLWFIPKRPFCKSSSFFFSMLFLFVFGRLFRFPFSSLSVKPLQLFFSFLFRLFLTFFNLVLSKNNPFLRKNIVFYIHQKNGFWISPWLKKFSKNCSFTIFFIFIFGFFWTSEKLCIYFCLFWKKTSKTQVVQISCWQSPTFSKDSCFLWFLNVNTKRENKGRKKVTKKKREETKKRRSKRAAKIYINN